MPSGAAAVPLGDFIKYGGAWARRGGLRFEHWRRLALQREASLRGEREKLGTAQGAVAEGKKGSASAEASEPKGKTFRESKSPMGRGPKKGPDATHWFAYLHELARTPTRSRNECRTTLVFDEFCGLRLTLPGHTRTLYESAFFMLGIRA